MKIIQDLLEEEDPGGLYIFVDPVSGFTRDPIQILEYLEAELAIHFPVPSSLVTIDQAIETQGNVETGPIIVNQSQQPSEFRQSERIKNIKKELTNQNKRLIILVNACHALPPNTLNFLAHLYKPDRGIQAGFSALMVCACETNNESCVHSHRLGQSLEWITLPSQYSNKILEEAIGDLMVLLKSWGREDIKAITLLEAHKFHPKNLHDYLPWLAIRNV